MTTDIATTAPARMGAFNEHDDALVRALGLNPNSPTDQAAVAVCRTYGFDPLLNHVVVIPKSGVYITRDGLLAAAHRTGQLDGIVVDQEPTYDQTRGEWVARVSVYRKDMTHPFTFPGRYPKAGKNREYAPEMALKSAEMHALRRAFNITGLPSEGERAEQPPSSGGVASALAERNTKPEPSTEDVTDRITSAQTRKLGALFTEAGYKGAGARDNRLRISSQIVGRDLDTSNDLTAAEASQLIDTLTELKTRGHLVDDPDALLEAVATARQEQEALDEHDDAEAAADE